MPTVYITAPPEDASDIARILVEKRLAACVNQVPCQSVYRWDSEIQTDDEVILLAKTTAGRYEELRDRVEEIHPYDVPCIERFDETDVLDSFEEWIVAETAPNQNTG
jgi:periplasmic divalent cation tolerance protein